MVIDKVVAFKQEVLASTSLPHEEKGKRPLSFFLGGRMGGVGRRVLF